MPKQTRNLCRYASTRCDTYEYYLSYAEQKAHEIQYAQKERRRTNNESSENFYENSKNPFLRVFGGIVLPSI